MRSRLRGESGVGRSAIGPTGALPPGSSAHSPFRAGGGGVAKVDGWPAGPLGGVLKGACALASVPHASASISAKTYHAAMASFRFSLRNDQDYTSMRGTCISWLSKIRRNLIPLRPLACGAGRGRTALGPAGPRHAPPLPAPACPSPPPPP